LCVCLYVCEKERKRKRKKEKKKELQKQRIGETFSRFLKLFKNGELNERKGRKRSRKKFLFIFFQLFKSKSELNERLSLKVEKVRLTSLGIIWRFEESYRVTKEEENEKN